MFPVQKWPPVIGLWLPMRMGNGGGAGFARRVSYFWPRFAPRAKSGARHSRYQSDRGWRGVEIASVVCFSSVTSACGSRLNSMSQQFRLYASMANWK